MRYFLLVAILLFGVTGFAQNKTGTIANGNTYVDLNFTAADTINTSETYWIQINNFQDFPQMLDVWIDLTDVSGTPSVAVTCYGKKFSSDSWTQIGSPVTWTAADFNYPVTTAFRYRYLKIALVASGATQQTLINNIEVKAWNTGGDLSTSNLTLSGALTAASVVSPLYDVTGAAGITFGSADATKFTFSGISEDLVLTPSGNTWTLSTSTGVTAIAVGGLNLTGIGDVGLDGTITFAAPNKLISAGSYASKLTAPTGSTTEWVTIGAEGTEDDFQIGQGIYLEMSGEDGKGFPLSTLVEATNTTGTPTLQGLQSMAFLGTVGGTEAAVLKTMGGDATAGMYGGWFKVGANTNTVAASGSRVAPLWVDNQMGGTVSGEEYGIFLTAGGTVPDAAFGFETTSSGWSQLFYFDETAYDQEPVSNTSLKVLVNATQYYLPMSTSNTLFSSAYGVQVPTYNFADATAVAGSADAITIDFTADLTISTGTVIYFIAEAANTGAATLAIDGGPAIAIVESSDGSALEAGDIPNAGCIQLMYDGTSWQQLSQSGN